MNVKKTEPGQFNARKIERLKGKRSELRNFISIKEKNKKNFNLKLIPSDASEISSFKSIRESIFDKEEEIVSRILSTSFIKFK